MTTLPVRCRKTNDAVREPCFGDGSRVRRDLAGRPAGPDRAAACAFGGAWPCRLRLTAAAPATGAAGTTSAGAGGGRRPVARAAAAAGGRSVAGGRADRHRHQVESGHQAARARGGPGSGGARAACDRHCRRRARAGIPASGHGAGQPAGCRRVGTSGALPGFGFGAAGGGGAGGAGGFSSGSLVFSGGGGAPSAGLGLPTTIQLPAGSCTRCAVSLDGIMPRLRAASASAGADSASSTSRSSASFCCISASLSWPGRCPVGRSAAAASVDSHSVTPSPTPSAPMTRTTNGTLAIRVCGRRSMRGQPGDQPLAQWRPDDLGSLGLPGLGARLGLAGGLGPGRPFDGPRRRARSAGPERRPRGSCGRRRRGAACGVGVRGGLARRAGACRALRPLAPCAAFVAIAARSAALRPTFISSSPRPFARPAAVPVRCADCVRSRRRRHVRRRGSAR